MWTGSSCVRQGRYDCIQQAGIANLEAKHPVIKLVPEGGKIIEEGGLLHGVALNHAVHEPQGTQHHVTLSMTHNSNVEDSCIEGAPKAAAAGPHISTALFQVLWLVENCEDCSRIGI